MKTIGYVTAADPFHDRKAWSGTIYKVREAIENAGFNVFWIPVRLSFLHNLYVKISAFRYGRLVSRNMDNVAVRLRAEGIKFPDETIIDYYVDAIKRSHLLLLPTSAECSAIVFSEAAAYGLPVFTYDTGGIGNYVIDGYNGYRLRLGASANDFSVKIKETLFDGKLTKLSGNALQLYADNLSWSAWSRRFRGIIEEYENNK